MRKATAGFTLIEIMIVVAIVAILSAIAIPSYRDYIQRGKLVTATNNLQAFQSAMEQYYQDNRTYLSTSASPIASPCGTGGVVSATSISGWTFGCSPAPTASTYTITATGTQGLTLNFGYSINQLGQASTTNLPSNWPTPHTAACFVTKKGMTC
jgi:type IV pilus assembly protein PilE